MIETQKNLRCAYAGEGMARNKYTTFSRIARKEGFESIARIFEETADNERAHAKRLHEFMQGEPSTELVDYTVAPMGDTKANLKEAADGERYEHSKMYPLFKEIALKENQKKIASVFQEIAEVEEEHEKRYRALLANLKQGKIFKRARSVKWKCLNCGYVNKSKTAPKICPACNHPQAFYEIWARNY